MAYGRLDVFWPDGEFHTFPLTEPNITVGRSSGSTIALESENISRYHFNLAYDGTQVTIADMESANGTFVDGVRLENSQRQPLNGGEEIQIGDLRLIYRYLDDSPTRPMVVPEETTQRIELEAPAFRIDLKAPDQGVPPGAHISAERTISNTADEVETYLVEVTGLPADWVRIDRATVRVQPNDSAQVVISFKPARRSDSAPGNYPVFVTVRPGRDTSAPLKADLDLHVLPFGGFGMALQPHHVSAEGHFRVHLHNQGSAPLALTLSARDKNNALQFDFEPAQQITLAPGQRLVVSGDVSPRKSAVYGADREYAFDVLVQSADAAHFMAAERGYVVVPPSLPRWTPLALAGAVAAVIGIIVVAVIGWSILSHVEPPVINSFTVNSTQIAQGEPLVVAWSAENASQLTITVNQTPVFVDDGGGEPTSYTVNTNELDGDVVVALAAAGQGAPVIASQTIHVTRPMRIDLFTVNPPKLVRNVVQSLSISWDVPGAALIRITGLESFTTTPIDPSYPAKGSLNSVAGIAQNPLTLTLFGQDADGSTVQQAVTVDMVDPTCAPTSAAVPLRAGPSEQYQVVGTLPVGTQAIITAQDSSSQWLQVQLAGGTAGWGPRTAFTCADFFSVDNLRKELNVPTVTPTIEATPTVTGTTPAQPTQGPTATLGPQIAVTPTAERTAAAATSRPTTTP